MYGFSREVLESFNRWALEICKEFYVDAVAGPVLSGAVMASSLATASSNLQAIFLPKHTGLYQPFKHNEGIKQAFGMSCPKRVMLIDDVIESGGSMLKASEDILSHWTSAEIVVFVCKDNREWNESKRIKDVFPNAPIRDFDFGI